jgi:putative ABC transport system ATP-binding protein
MNNFQIECISLGKQFTTRRQTISALSDINLKVNENELFIIKGRSGAGKSTLLSLMSGLTKPTTGKVKIGNMCISDLSGNALSNLLLNKVGFIFQNFNLLPTYNIYENIEAALVPKGLDKKEIRMLIEPVLEQFDLSDKRNMFPSELSIGQQQKVAVARTIVKQPSLIFADEPAGSVDDETAGEIIRCLLQLKEHKKVTIVLATHGGFPEKYADRSVILENGRIKD